MSDQSVHAALRSADPLVVIEAPAGCGKTYQGAEYACDAASLSHHARVLVLTHTHAAVSAFTEATKAHSKNVTIRTIDGLLVEIASMYHVTLGLPREVAAWASRESKGYEIVTCKVLELLRHSPLVTRSLVERYPIVICDEHQDASADQESAVLTLLDQGARLRIFGDPMQRIFGTRGEKSSDADTARWSALLSRADHVECLDTPHRWSGGAEALGAWILRARAELMAGRPLDLRPPHPSGLRIVIAENVSMHPRRYQIAREQSAPIYRIAQNAKSLLVLAAYTETVRAAHALFNRRFVLWEGQVRDALPRLVEAMKAHEGNPQKLCEAIVAFLEDVATGFTASAFSGRLLQEISEGCVRRCRDKSAQLQELGKIILLDPSHRGVARMFTKLQKLIAHEAAFAGIRLDYRREFWEAISLGEFDDCDKGLSHLSQRRAHSQTRIPSRAISTIHKAKGLDADHVMLMACDEKHFTDDFVSRCKLYVAMSRARRELTMVVSAKNPTSLVRLS